MTTTTTLDQLAGQAYDQFESRTRGNGDQYVTLKNGAPDWLGDLVREAHGDMLPDDWRYATIRAALSFIHDNGLEDADDAHDAASEFADGNVDTYNNARAAWLASDLSRAGYCDDAAGEFGYTAESDGIYGLIALGQYAESSEVYGIVVDQLAAELEDQDS